MRPAERCLFLLVCIIAPFGRVATLEASMMCEVCRRIVNLHRARLRKRTDEVVLCVDHVAAFREAGELVSAEPISPSTPAPRARAGARGEPPEPAPGFQARCQWPGCESPVKSCGFCFRDYYRVRKLRLAPSAVTDQQVAELPAMWEAHVAAPSLRGAPPKHLRCLWPGCDRKHLAHGLCSRDYGRVRLLGIPFNEIVYAELPARWRARLGGGEVSAPPVKHASCADCQNEPVCPKQVQVDACVAAGRLAAPVTATPPPESPMPKPVSPKPRERALPKSRGMEARARALRDPALEEVLDPPPHSRAEPEPAAATPAEVAQLEALDIEKRIRWGICGMLHTALGSPAAADDAGWDLPGLLALVEAYVNAKLSLDEQELRARYEAYEEYRRAPESVSGVRHIYTEDAEGVTDFSIEATPEIVAAINAALRRRREALLWRALRGDELPKAADSGVVAARTAELVS